MAKAPALAAAAQEESMNESAASLKRKEPEIEVLVDGFPRSEVQVECLKLFHERMHGLRKECKHTPIKVNFPRPTFKICVLHVDEEISINHQLMRGKLIKEHNAKVMRSGKGEVMEERVTTDFDEMPTHSRLIPDPQGPLPVLAKAEQNLSLP
ncbi:hypothetical protein BGX24_004182, partial [Mortierella sp. AD032]